MNREPIQILRDQLKRDGLILTLGQVVSVSPLSGRADLALGGTESLVTGALLSSGVSVADLKPGDTVVTAFVNGRHIVLSTVRLARPQANITGFPGGIQLADCGLPSLTAASYSYAAGEDVELAVEDVYEGQIRRFGQRLFVCQANPSTSYGQSYVAAPQWVALDDAHYLQGRVVASTEPTTGQALVYDAMARVWGPGSISSEHSHTTVPAHDHTGDTGDGGKVDHGELNGLGDDDHVQYLNSARHAALKHDHGGLDGLADDDHLHYFNAARLAGMLPKRATRFATGAKALVGSFAWTVDGAQIFGLWGRNPSGANGDAFTHGFVCAAGTYTISILHIKRTIGGKVDFYVDGNLISSGNDSYAATVTQNALFTISNVSLAAGWHQFKGVINGRNASSTGYYFYWTAIEVIPAAD